MPLRHVPVHLVNQFILSGMRYLRHLDPEAGHRASRSRCPLFCPL